MAKENNTIRYVRRIPREAYGHEEAEVIRSIDADTDVDMALLDAKAAVLNVLGETVDQEIAEANDFEIGPEVEADEDTMILDEDGNDEQNLVSDDEDEDDLSDEEEEEPAAIVEEPPKKKRGRPKKEAASEPVETVEENVVDESDDVASADDEDEEEIDLAPAKPKARVRTATTVFDTKNKSHQSLVRDVFSDIMPKWQLIAKPKLKEITAELNETDLLDGEGDVLKTFRDQAKKLLVKAQQA